MEIIIGIAVILGVIMLIRGFLRGFGSKGTVYGVATILERFIKWGVSAVVILIIIIFILSAFN